MRVKEKEARKIVQLINGWEGQKWNGTANQEQELEMMRNIMYGGMFGAESVMDVETVMVPYRKIVHTKKMSDSLLHKQLGKASVEDVRDYCYGIHRALRQEKMFLFQLSDGRTIRLGHVDGSHLMTHAYEALAISGIVKAGIDYEPCTKGGNECVKAPDLLRRAKRNGIALDLVTGDGITYNVNYWNEVRSEGISFFTSVRGNDQRGLVMIKETEDLIKADEISPISARQVKTEELNHGDAHYRIQVAPHYHDQLKCRIVIGKIAKKYLKGKRAGTQEIHYVLTDMISLLPKDMISVAIAHWEVEEYFDELKNDFWSAQSYKENEEDAQKLLLLVSTAMNLVKYCKVTIFTDDAMSDANKKRFTKKIVRLLLSRMMAEISMTSSVEN